MITILPPPIYVAKPHTACGGGDLQAIAATLAPQYAELRQAAEMYADHQDHRKAMMNRIGSMKVNANVYIDHAVVLMDTEKTLGRLLERLYRTTIPEGIQAWQKSTLGIGELSLARVLGHLGHPRLATPKYFMRNTTIADDKRGDATNPKRKLFDGEPYLRRLDQLRAYCGHGKPQRRVKGMDQADAMADGNDTLKMLVYLLSVGVVKAQSRETRTIALGPLGQFYQDEYARYAERVHTGPCPRCKVNEGDPFRPSHVNAIALRHLGKRIISELYTAAEEPWCNESSAPQVENDPQASLGGGHFIHERKAA